MNPSWLVQREISFAEGMAGKYRSKVLVVSHRWETPGEPDGENAQHREIVAYLRAHPNIELVWYDYWCMPQEPNRTKLEKLMFKCMLPNINLLYLFAAVLVLLDMSYMSRFWTSLESFLAMREVTASGLSAVTDVANRRFSVVCLHNAPPMFKEFLIKLWASSSAEEAHDILKRPDVTVTNNSDKDVQLPKLLRLNEFSKQMWAKTPPAEGQQRSRQHAADLLTGAAIGVGDARARMEADAASLTAQVEQLCEALAIADATLSNADVIALANEALGLSPSLTEQMRVINASLATVSRTLALE